MTVKKKKNGTWESKRHRDYKYREKKRGNSYPFSLEQSKALFRLPCFYCTKAQAKGMDRLDNDLGYIDGNIVPCCAICNTILSTLPHLAKMEMREALRAIHQKDLLKDWQPIFMVPAVKKEEVVEDVEDERTRCENCNEPSVGFTSDDVPLCEPCGRALEESSDEDMTPSCSDEACESCTAELFESNPHTNVFAEAVSRMQEEIKNLASQAVFPNFKLTIEGMEGEWVTIDDQLITILPTSEEAERVADKLLLESRSVTPRPLVENIETLPASTIDYSDIVPTHEMYERVFDEVKIDTSELRKVMNGFPDKYIQSTATDMIPVIPTVTEPVVTIPEPIPTFFCSCDNYSEVLPGCPVHKETNPEDVFNWASHTFDIPQWSIRGFKSQLEWDIFKLADGTRNAFDLIIELRRTYDERNIRSEYISMLNAGFICYDQNLKLVRKTETDTK